MSRNLHDKHQNIALTTDVTMIHDVWSVVFQYYKVKNLWSCLFLELACRYADKNSEFKLIAGMRKCGIDEPDIVRYRCGCHLCNSANYDRLVHQIWF